MQEGSSPGDSDALGPKVKEHLLRLARRHGVKVSLPSAEPGQFCAQPVTFSSSDGEAVCIALIPAKATPEEELRIIAREVAYVIARDRRAAGRRRRGLIPEEEADLEAQRLLDRLREIASKRSENT